MNDIVINVSNKKASVIGCPAIVCGNSDYRLVFNFDSEWDGLTMKTARFRYEIDNVSLFTDVAFSGNNCEVPILSNITEVKVGVYAGELSTTTPAVINCRRSILCGNPADNIDSDVYEQLLELLNSLITDETHFLDAVLEQNEQQKMRFWIGTEAEYNEITNKQNNTFYITTDSGTEAEIAADIAALDERVEANEDDIAVLNGRPVPNTVLWSGVVDKDSESKVLTVEGLSNYNLIGLKLQAQNDIDMIGSLIVFAYVNVVTGTGAAPQIQGSGIYESSTAAYQYNISCTRTGTVDEIRFVSASARTLAGVAAYDLKLTKIIGLL